MKPRTPRLLEKYRTEIAPALRKQFGYKNSMAVPRIMKVVVNVGVGRMAKDTKFIEKVEHDIMHITGQKPSRRVATKSIAGFKLREGMQVGVAVTLRATRMYDFIDRLIAVALPRARDFHGLKPTSIDATGNLNMGIREQNIFPEVTYESLKDIFSLQVTITTTAKTRKEGEALFRLLGFPLAV